MRDRTKRISFNVTVIILTAIAVVVLGFLAWGQIKAIFDEEPRPQPPSYVSGAIRAAPELASEGLDTTTLDQGRFEIPPDPSGRMMQVRLPNDTTIVATQQQAELLQYLQSSQIAGRRFRLPSIDFVGRDEVRQDPDGALVSLAAILNAFPDTRIRIEGIERNPIMAAPRDRAVDRAASLASAIVANGVPQDRVTYVGVKSESAMAPTIELVVTAK